MNYYALAGQWTVVVIVALVLLFLFASWVGGLLHDAAERQEAEVKRQQTERAARIERQRRLLAFADAIESEPESTRLRMYREAEALGFTDQDDAA